MTLKQNETLQARSNHFINHHPIKDTAVIVTITTKHGIFRLISAQLNYAVLGLNSFTNN